MEYLRSDSDGEGETLSDSRPVRLCGCDSPKHTVGVLALSEHTANQGFCKSASCASCPGAENQRPRPRRLILRRPARRPATQDLLNRGDTESKTTLSFKGGDLHLGLRGLESLFAQSWVKYLELGSNILAKPDKAKEPCPQEDDCDVVRTPPANVVVVQCGMLWWSEAQKDKEQESRLYVQSEAKQASNTTDSVKRAFAVIGQRWKNECGISVTKEPDVSGNLVYSMKIPDHTSKDFSNDGLRNEVPAHGVLFVSLQLPHVKGVDSNIALQKAIERAVHHVVAQFAAADCIFFIKNRQLSTLQKSLSSYKILEN